jgi:hypothetical protein
MMTDALAYVTTYTYDSVFNMMTSTTRRGRVTTYTIDPAMATVFRRSTHWGRRTNGLMTRARQVIYCAFKESLFTALRFSFSSGSRYCRVVSMSLCPISFCTVTISHPLSRRRVA